MSIGVSLKKEKQKTNVKQIKECMDSFDPGLFALTHYPVHPATSYCCTGTLAIEHIHLNQGTNSPGEDSSFASFEVLIFFLPLVSLV